MICCPYCNLDAHLVSGDTIYPHRPDLHHLHFWHCAPCGAYVGCHRGTERPLGGLANVELRLAKQQAHAAFDPLWKFHTWTDGYQTMTRDAAYEWLADQLGMSRADCHVGMFDVEQCQRVVEICNERDK